MIIEKNIPIPSVSRAKYPWDDLEVGDSFKANSEPSTLRSCARFQNKKTGKEFAVRKDGDGARAWRTE